MYLACATVYWTNVYTSYNAVLRYFQSFCAQNGGNKEQDGTRFRFCPHGIALAINWCNNLSLYK